MAAGPFTQAFFDRLSVFHHNPPPRSEDHARAKQASKLDFAASRNAGLPVNKAARTHAIAIHMMSSLNGLAFQFVLCLAAKPLNRFVNISSWPPFPVLSK